MGLVDAVLRLKVLNNRLGISSNGLLFLFYIYFVEVYSFRKKQKDLFRKMFGSPHTRNRIYIL